MKKSLLLVLTLISCSTYKTQQIYRPVLASEGNFVMLGEPSFRPIIEQRLTLERLELLEQKLAPALEIELTPKGFVMAATRLNSEKGDDTNYDAVWVRDSVWVYFSLLEEGQNEKARKLILAMWDYYSSPDQIQRFKNIIKNPSLSVTGGMNVPHIRFDSKSEDFQDVMKDGKPEEWNHRQNDAHGLFLLGIAQAINQTLIRPGDFTRSRLEVLNLFPTYFDAINFWDFADAGAWEEVSRINTSSVAMVVKAFENWPKKSPVSWSKKGVTDLIQKGYQRIRKNLAMGGESPDHSEKGQLYRKEDAALFNLFLPMPLKHLSASEKLLALTLLEKLIRPYGVIRYPLDSYQSGNYWNKSAVVEGMPELTGDSSSSDAFKARFVRFIPDTEAQWFFDSKLAMIYLQFSKDDPKYAWPASLHFKRALGQLTPEKSMVVGADGNKVPNLAFPESINTVVNDGRYISLPSPITPLNWAKASFSMLLNRYQTFLKEN